jgi:hypothetical protein
VLHNNAEYLTIKDHNKSQGMIMPVEDIKNTATVKLIFRKISITDEKDGKIQFTCEAPVNFDVNSLAASSTDDENIEKIADGQLSITCDNIDLSQIEDLSHGLYEVFCQLSFNGQDFPPLSKEAVFSICHSFTPLCASPCSYSIGELNRLVEVYHRQENNQVDSFEAMQEFIDYHVFERKVTVNGQSLFPSNKLQKGSHIMAVAQKCILSDISDQESGSEMTIDAAELLGLEELIVHGDSTTVMHFTMNSSYLRQVQALIVDKSQNLKFSADDLMVKVFFVFQIETPSMNAMKKVLLSEESIPFFFFPTMKPSLSKYFFCQSGDDHVVSFVRANGHGFPFNSTSAIVRVHASMDDSHKFIYELSSEKITIREMEQRHDERQNSGEPSEHDCDVQTKSQPRYCIDARIPSLDDLVQYSKSLYPSGTVNISSLMRTTCVSISLDGLSIPREHEWRKVFYYSKDLMKYTLQQPVPKGGAPAGSQINLVLTELIPLELSEFVRVRLRGSDASITTSSLTVQLTESTTSEGMTSIILTFNIPDAPSLSQVPPTINGKEKLYHVDISVDCGESYEMVGSAVLQVK